MWTAIPASSCSLLGRPAVPWSPSCFTRPTRGCARSGPFRSASYSKPSATSSVVGAHTHAHTQGSSNQSIACFTSTLVLTSPAEYQRNHAGASGGSCAPSMGAPAGGSSGGGNTQGSAVPSGPHGGGGSRRPSRIPQPSRLPQPLRHHPGAESEGPNKMSGMETSSGFVK